MYTKICYLYRDASNYKRLNEICVNGIFTESQKTQIIESLNDGEYFIPRAVGWPEIRVSVDYNEDDHCWFELHIEDFNEIFDKPAGVEMINRTPEQIVEDFASAEWEDWENDWWMETGR